VTRIYHLALEANWTEAKASGSYRISSIDRTLEEEGFIHCSYAEQLQGTADRFYKNRDDVLLLGIETDLLDAELRVEAAGNGQQFPHLYGPLATSAVVSVTPIVRGDDGRLLISLDVA
jgi:uncharacterized protein (DUF952 family)